MKESILFCIAYKHKENRIHLLKNVIQNLMKYKEKYEIKIIIDTDSNDLCFNEKEIECKIWNDLQHPYHLTYMHRLNFLENLSKYDYFFYLEDDIVVPLDNFEEYLKNFDILWDYGCIPSFVTIEKCPPKNKEVAVFWPTNFTSQSKRFTIKINDCIYFNPTHSYHALWILSRNRIEQILSIPRLKSFYLKINETREDAASFSRMIGKTPVLLLDGTKISKLSYAYHISCNYSNNPNIIYGKLPVEKINVTN